MIDFFLFLLFLQICSFLVFWLIDIAVKKQVELEESAEEDSKLNITDDDKGSTL